MEFAGDTGADPENELGGSQFRGSGGQTSPSGVQGRSRPPEADDFSQLKASWGAWPPWPPLNPPVAGVDKSVGRRAFERDAFERESFQREAFERYRRHSL